MKKAFFALGALVSFKLWAYGTGPVVAPMNLQDKIVSVEFAGITSLGGGVGMQTRYTHKINPKLIFDGGIGMGGGAFDNRIFAGADYLVFPDYKRLPRVSLKIAYENAQEFSQRLNIVSLSPIASKGFRVGKTESFPYMALPIGLKLNSETGSYETSLAGRMGILTKVPWDNKKPTFGFEGTINFKNAFSGIFLSLGYPLQ